MKTISYSELRENLKEELDIVSEDHTPLIVKRRNGNDMVIMSLEDYNSFQETIYLLGSPANAAHLMKSIKQLENGEIVEVTMEQLRTYETSITKFCHTDESL